MSEHKCGGHCCKSFMFPFSPEELERMKGSIDDHTMRFLQDNGMWREHGFPKHEVDKLADMLIFQTLDPINPATLKPTIPRPPAGDKYSSIELKNLYERGYRIQEDGTVHTHKYTCKHYDHEQGLCGNYENRPRMCSGYPDDGVCSYTNCQGGCSTLNMQRKLDERMIEVQLKDAV